MSEKKFKKIKKSLTIALAYPYYRFSRELESQTCGAQGRGRFAERIARHFCCLNESLDKEGLPGSKFSDILHPLASVILQRRPGGIINRYFSLY